MGQLLFLAKKYYFAVNLATASLVAVSSSALVSNTVESSLDVAPTVVKSKKKKSRSQKNKRTRSEDYDTILTGNLLRDNTAVTETGDANVNPTDITLLGTISGSWSIAAATIKMKGEKETKEYGSGAKLGDYRIAWIGRNKIIVKNAAGEKITIEVDTGENKQVAAAGKAKTKDTGKKPVGGKHTKVVTRDEVNRLLADQTKLMKGLRMGPKMRDGKLVGYKIKRLKKKHFFYKLGARSGDILTRVNGNDLDDMQKLYGLLGELKSADRLVIDLERKKTPTTYEILIK